MTTEEPLTPLTLEYSPEGVEGDPEQIRHIVVCEPSFQHNGRIFLGVHPTGRRIGCHLLPDDARRVRDHLSKLLLDREESPSERLPAPEGRVDWAQRVREAAERVREPRQRKRHLGHFRLEAAFGRLIVVIGTKQDDA